MAKCCGMAQLQQQRWLKQLQAPGSPQASKRQQSLAASIAKHWKATAHPVVEYEEPATQEAEQQWQQVKKKKSKTKTHTPTPQEHPGTTETAVVAQQAPTPAPGPATSASPNTSTPPQVVSKGPPQSGMGTQPSTT